MLNGITQAAAQLATVSAREPAAASAASPRAFAAVIRREQPAAEAPSAGGPLSARAPGRTDAPGATEGPGMAERSLRRIVTNQRQLERSMQRALRGDDFSPQQLLALQMQVHKYSTEVEAVSRVVDRVTGAVKQAMQTQI